MPKYPFIKVLTEKYLVPAEYRAIAADKSGTNWRLSPSGLNLERYETAYVELFRDKCTPVFAAKDESLDDYFVKAEGIARKNVVSALGRRYELVYSSSSEAPSWSTSVWEKGSFAKNKEAYINPKSVVGARTAGTVQLGEKIWWGLYRVTFSPLVALSQVIVGFQYKETPSDDEDAYQIARLLGYTK